MSKEAAFLTSLGQTLATMALYNDGHPARERAIDASYDALLQLIADRPCTEFSFLGGETIAGTRPLAELGCWEWAAKFADARLERIEIDADVSRDAYLRFLDDVYRRLGRSEDTSAVGQMTRSPIRYGLLRVKGAGGDEHRGRPSGPFGAGGWGEGAALPLAEEITAIDWIHEEIKQGLAIPMLEVETVVRSLAAAIRADERVFLPLLTLKDYDQYTTTHACNVAVLAMGLSERLGLSPAETRSFGVAGLLHDIGKVRVPHELLTKPGRFTDEERTVVQRHPVDGARIILERERGLGLAAVVAYEHHIFLNGQGYPSLRYPRACHYAIRIVHICDIYDALCTDRPYRQAWEPDQALSYLTEQSGKELDPDIVRSFHEMVSEAKVDRIPFDEARATAAV
jgi:putative nucleotidyltransferase with HDIG domain